MPLPELGLSMSITDNNGSAFYAGAGKREDMGERRMFNEDHTITITISDEESGFTTVDLVNDVGNIFQIDLPTYKMKLTDDKTNDESLYEVTRDRLLFKELNLKENIGGFSVFGLNFLKKKQYVLPSIAYEPKLDKIETFEVSRYRTLKLDYLSYHLRKTELETGFLVAGKLPKELFENSNPDCFFCVIDNSEGLSFIGDIQYREKFIKKTPKVVVNVIKRDKQIKEVNFNKKGISEIIYL